jgi:dolichol-phosphate mannosyltransferase
MTTEPGERTIVVVPTYNEKPNLSRVVALALAAAPEVDVLVVDDASPDGTGEVADGLARESAGRVHVIHRAGKEGLGPAYLEGFRWALAKGYARICQMDADLSHPPDVLPQLIAEAKKEGIDFVVGSRYAGGSVTVVNWPIGRLLISIFGNAYARFATGLPVSDATGGFNLFNRRVVEALDLDRIASTGYTFQVELKLRSWRKGFRFTEVPIIFTERGQGESKMSKRIVLEAVWKVWKLRVLRTFGRL